MFNVLNGMVDYENISVLDLFAGTGAVSFEFCSRGALSVTSVDIERSCITFITHTAEQFGMKELKAIRSNAFVFLKRAYAKYDLIFADPPYDMQGIADLPGLINASDILNHNGLFVLEHSDKYNFMNSPLFREERKYGRVHFTFFQKKSGEETG